MTDSRLKQAEILIDDARTLLADMAEEGFGGDQLEAARCSLNVSLRHLQILRQCTASPMGGGRCELEAGHDGKHRKKLTHTWFEWTEDSQQRLVAREGSRFD